MLTLKCSRRPLTLAEMVKANIINIFGFSLKDNIFEWSENYVQDHPNYTFEELGQAFCKCFKIVKNDEEVHMQMRDIQQRIANHVEVYDEHLSKLANYLHVIATNVFITIFFKAILLPYLRLTTANMRRNTLTEHKEVVVVCEESGLISLNYNVLLTTP
jgi:hypothetical protein